MKSDRNVKDRGRAPSRRTFLRGAGGVALALPVLESLSKEAPRAATAKPIYGMFICGVQGVVPAAFFPDAPGPITRAGLAAATSKATSALSRHADDLLLVSGVDWPSALLDDPHNGGLCIALTGRKTAAGTTGPKTMASGPSADAFITSRTSPGKSVLALYAGDVQSFGGPHVSFLAAEQRAPVISNPYDLYAQLVGLAGPDGMTPASRATAEKLLESRKSVHDLVLGEVTTLMQHPRLSAADRQKLQLHLDSLRDAERALAGMAGSAAQCSTLGLDVTRLEALKTYVYDRTRTDEIVRLHMSLVAMAFACDYRRAASLQWGDPYDQTVYDVPSNVDRVKFSFISHRIDSDAAAVSDAANPKAMQAHAEIDAARMATLAAGLDHFKARGLADQSFVMWTVNYADGPAHAFRNIPHIIWGNAGGFLKQGQFVSAGGVTNDRLLNTLLTAALQDSQTVVTDFGGSATGLLDVIRK